MSLMAAYGASHNLTASFSHRQSCRGPRSNVCREFFGTEARLLDDGRQRFALEVAIVKGHCHAELGPRRMFEDVVRAGSVMNEKTGPLQSADDFFGFERR